MTDLALSFVKARADLMQKCQVEYSFAENALSSIEKVIAVYIAYQRIFPDDYRSRLESQLPGRLVELRGRRIDLGNRCVLAIANLFPVSETMLEEADDCIWIEPQGPSMSWDEFDALLEREYDPGYADISLTFPVLVWSIGNSIDRETWEKLNEMFNWGVAWPQKLIETSRYFDEALLQKKLQRAGLGDFMTSIKIAWRTTDNFFFDLDENYDYEVMNAPGFDAEGICDLYKEWQAAQPIAESDTRAMRMVQQDPSVLQRVVDIMGKSLKKPAKAKRLIEVFAGQETTHE